MTSTSLFTAATPSSSTPFSSHFHLHHKVAPASSSSHRTHKRQQLSSILTSSSSSGSATTSCQLKMHKTTQRTRITTNPNALPPSTARVMAAAFLTQSLSNVFTVAKLKAEMLVHQYNSATSSAQRGGSSVDDAFIDDSLYEFMLRSPETPAKTTSKHRRSSLGELEHLAVSVLSAASLVSQVDEVKSAKKPVKQVRFADSMPGCELAQVRLFQNSDNDDEGESDSSAVKARKVHVCRQQSITKMSPLLLKSLKSSLEERRVRASAIHLRRNVNSKVAQDDVFLSDDDDAEEPSDTGEEESSEEDDAAVPTAVEALLGAVKLDDDDTCRFDIDNFSFEWSLGDLGGLGSDRLTDCQMVKLVKLRVAKASISGQIKVKNLCYHKRVFLKHTFDNWLSTAQLECQYQDSSSSSSSPGEIDEQVDTFAFTFDLDKSLILRLIDENFCNTGPSADKSKYRNAPPSFRFEFAVGFQPASSSSSSAECCYWDNNGSQNYHLDCFFKVSSPLRRCGQPHA